MRSQIIVELVLVGQVDPAEDEGGQGQGEHHDEHGRARVAIVLRLAGRGDEGQAARCFPGVSLALQVVVVVLLGATLPGAEGTTDGGGRGGPGILFAGGWRRLCL